MRWPAVCRGCGGDDVGAGEEVDAAAEDEGGAVDGGVVGELRHAALEGVEGADDLGVDAGGVGFEIRVAVKGSAAKAGLSVGVARARCISAVRRPRSAAASR